MRAIWKPDTKQRDRLRREKLEVVIEYKDPLELLRLSYELVTARKEIQIVFSSAYYHYQRKSFSLFTLFEMPAGNKVLDVKAL